MTLKNNLKFGSIFLGICALLDAILVLHNYSLFSAIVTLIATTGFVVTGLIALFMKGD